MNARRLLYLALVAVTLSAPLVHAGTPTVPVSFEGDVRIQSNSRGELVVALDRIDTGRGAGWADYVFVYGNENSPIFGVDRLEFDAHVEWERNRLRVLAADGHVLVDLHVGAGRPEAAELAARARGFALQENHYIAVGYGPIVSFDAELYGTLNPGSSLCGSGGVGSKSCSVTCAASFGPLGGLSDSCSASCSEGYYACCRCSAGDATCYCVPSGPQRVREDSR